MDFILNPFITVLTFLYSIFNQDMVLAIIVFTALVRLLTYPLTAQQMKSARVMQELQPELKKLQEKYKNDREKLSQEQMRMYREYGINPLGGCLPLLIQFPILIGLYQSIIHALSANPLSLIDLSGRLLVPGLSDVIPLENRWLGMNLSQPPDFATGAIIGGTLIFLVVVTTWAQFKLTTVPVPPSDDGKPNPTAATQQTMGTIMPVMYGFFAISFSVGLSIYFIASNVIGIIQSVLMGKANFRNLLPGAAAAQPAITPRTATITTSVRPTDSRAAPRRNTGTRPNSLEAGVKTKAPPKPNKTTK